MPLVRLIYVSRMTQECDTDALRQILDVSRKKNAAKDITGVLCYDPMFFMQCLEGPSEAVNELYTDIARDARHTQVTLLEYCDTDRRDFADWSMAFLLTGDLDPATLRKYSDRGKFNPFALTSQQARSFLVEIVTQKRERLADQTKTHFM